MTGSDWANRTEALKRCIDKALPLVLIVIMAMGGGALAVLATDFFSPYKYESSDKHYYQAECYRLELTKPQFPTIEDQNSPEGRKAQANWNKNYPPYCGLAAQFEASNSARSASQYAALTLILTFVGVVLLGLTLKATRDTLDQAAKATKAAEDATKTTREVGEAAERAILRCSILQRIHPEYDGLSLRVEHYGRTSAYNVLIQVSCRFRTKEGTLEKTNCSVKEREFREFSQAGNVTISFDFGLVKHLQTIGDCLVPTTLIFEVEIIYEDVFTIGTARDVIVSRQTFNGIDRAKEFKSVGRFEVGKKDRQEYEIARVGRIL